MSQNSPKIFCNRFIFKKKLSQGSFGIVYLVLDRATNIECALKVEKEENEETKTLEREIGMLIQLDGIIGIPKLIWHGVDAQMQMMAIELLGKDISYYFKQYRKFSLKCCLQVFYDCLEILKNIHKKFIIHRDLKPENIMMSKELDQIYIVDFGISKIYFEADHIPFRDDKEFVGTTRYASIAAHKGYELCRKDDLESLFYVIIYFLRGNLPWYYQSQKNLLQLGQNIVFINLQLFFQIRLNNNFTIKSIVELVQQCQAVNLAVKLQVDYGTMLQRIKKKHFLIKIAAGQGNLRLTKRG